MKKEYLDFKNDKIVKMFERINKDNNKFDSFDSSSRVSHDVITKTLVKSKIKSIYRVK